MALHPPPANDLPHKIGILIQEPLTRILVTIPWILLTAMSIILQALATRGNINERWGILYWLCCGCCGCCGGGQRRAKSQKARALQASPGVEILVNEALYTISAWCPDFCLHNAIVCVIGGRNSGRTHILHRSVLLAGQPSRDEGLIAAETM